MSSRLKTPKRLPFGEFLQSLQDVGFRLQAADWRRLALALRNGTAWTVGNLRGVCVALLSKDATEELQLLALFEQYLPFAPQTEIPPAALNLLLDELESRIRPVAVAPPPVEAAAPPASIGSASGVASAAGEAPMAGYTRLPFQHFRPEHIGGHFQPPLDLRLLDALAAEILAARAYSIQALDWQYQARQAALQGGYRNPAATRARPVETEVPAWVLLDRHSQPPWWNPLPAEVGNHLRRRGVLARDGGFELDRRGLRVCFDKTWQRLEELDPRQQAVLILFSDGSGLHSRWQQFGLESLRRHPRLLWLDWRDARAVAGNLPQKLGITPYPATAEGLLQAWRRSPPPRHRDDALRTQSIATQLPVMVDRILGDARPWAQACAMLPPPFGLGLAETLRTRFYPHLPQTRLGRLFSLPGAVAEQRAFYFAPRLLAVLRSGFARQEVPLQEKILAFLLELAQATEPAAGGVAHLEWQWYMERLRLETDPDRALPRLLKLAGEPALQARAAQESLGLALPHERGVATYGRIPLRRKPQTRRGLRQLQQFSPDCGIQPAELRPWRYRFWLALDYLRNRFTQATTIAACSPDGRRILTLSADGEARVWDSVQGEERQLLEVEAAPLQGLDDPPLRRRLRGWLPRSSLIAEVSPDGRRILTVQRDNTVKVWDAGDGRLLYIFKDYPLWLRSAVFTAEEEQIIAITGRGELWNIAKGQYLLTLAGHARSVNSLALSPDGKTYATASCDATARLWQRDTGQTLHILRGHRGRVMHAQFSADGSRLATAAADHAARLWDCRGGTCLLTLRGHRGRVNRAQFSPDGKLLVTASADRTARLWDIASGECLEVLQGHRAQVNMAVFSPNGEQVITAGNDGEVRTWKRNLPE